MESVQDAGTTSLTVEPDWQADLKEIENKADALFA